MNLDDFASACSLTSLPELGKVCHLAFFYLKTSGIEEFGSSDAEKWLTGLALPAPNRSRLEKHLSASRNTTRATRGHRLRREFIVELEKKYPSVGPGSQLVADHGSILPEVDYSGTRGYVESLAKQINAAYELNIFDGCAVLMRRLVEVLLILSYRNLGIETAIRDAAGNYKFLDQIIGDARTNPALALSRNSKEILDAFRKLGNFSAHKIEYICRREYIAPLIQDYRALVGELLYRSGIKK